MRLCHVLLMLDANYPWFILVPDREDIEEIYQLSLEDQRQLMSESSRIGQAIMHGFNGDKLNVAALGNVVPQLHIHHIVRYHDDPAWPAPVWGKVATLPYADDSREQVITVLKQVLGGDMEYRV
ncbi:HIT domain-containing protein [Thiohalophilus sp.]|uniref:HIT domain-containing protein n=1 Tax=Thiohalophilus sp. TaxID=3028392 RepID=UPI0028704061|nr:HIT domain-containing protein [Thiohalophilus sp.]